MSRTVNAAFDEYDEALKLNPDERQAAIDTHHEIRDWLAKANITAGAILQGSLARKTMLSPLRDIDMVVFLTEDYRYLTKSTSGPDRSMDILQNSLRELYPTATFERSRHAVKIDFGDDGFSFDVVPAFDRDGSKLIDIANRDNGTWDESDTRLVIEAVQTRNQECKGGFVRQVRMVKHWGREALTTIPGFVLECLAYAVITSAQEHPSALSAVFHEGATLVGAGTVNVPGSDENALDRLTDDEKATLEDALMTAAKRATEALDVAERGDHEAAIDIWRNLVGDPFPEAEEQSAADAFGAMTSGGITSTGRATRAANAHTPTPPVRSWRLT